MWRTGWLYAVQSCICVLGATGCAASRLVPNQPITVQNAHRLASAYRGQFASHVMDRVLMFPELSGGLKSAAVDSTRHRLFVLHNRLTGLQFMLPTRMDVIDLQSGLASGVFRIPSNSDMSGASGDSYAKMVPDALGGRLILADSLDDTWAVFALSMEDGGPTLLESGAHLAFVSADSRYVGLYLTESYFAHNGPGHEDKPEMHRDDALIIRSLSGRQPDRRYRMGSMPRNLNYQGMIGDYVIATRDAWRSPVELYVFQADSDQLQPIARRILDPGARPNSILPDAPRNRVLIQELSGRAGCKVRAYQVPSLDPADELDLAGEHQVDSQVFLQNAGILACILQYDPQNLRVYDFQSGRLLARRDISIGGGFDSCGAWRLFADPAERYIGICGGEWVQLFAIDREEGK